MTEFVPEAGMLKYFIDIVQNSGHLVWFLVFAMLGGTANYLGRVKRGEVKVFSLVELLGEWVISGFVAIATAHICIEYGLSFHMTAFLCGITGHMGGRAVFIFEVLVIQLMERKGILPVRTLYDKKDNKDND